MCGQNVDVFTASTILELVVVRCWPLYLFGFELLGRKRRSGVSAGELSRMEGTSRQGP